MGLVLPPGRMLLWGDHPVIDRAMWQCQGNDNDGARCRLVPSYIHKRRVDGKIRATALCREHYDAAGPESR